MKHFEVNNQKYLSVLVTKDAIVVKIGKNVFGKTCVVCKISEESRSPYGIELPEGSWEIVGQVKDLFNNKCKEVVGESTTWYSTKVGMSGEGTVPIDHIETSLMKFDKIRMEHNLSDNHLILKQL